MFRKVLLIVSAGLLLFSCSNPVRMTEEDMKQKFKEFAQNTPNVNADGNITFKCICSYPHQEVDEYGKAIQTCYIDEMTDREVSLVAELIWAARIKQQRGRIYLAALSREPCIQQMMNWFGNDIEDSTIVMNFQRMERVIFKLRDNLYNKMREKNVREVILYDVYVDSVYTITAVVDDGGNIGFSGITTDEFEKAILSSFSTGKANEASVETIAQTLKMAEDVHKVDCYRFNNIARSFLCFQIAQGNSMFLNGKKIQTDNRNEQKYIWLKNDSLSSLGRYIYEWRDSIYSTDAGNSIATNAFRIKKN